jgi:class 3 adenylate cyclase
MTQTILIADDDANARSFLQVVLEQEGYAVVHAESGEHALALVSRHHIDGIFLNIEIPSTNGIGLCRALRAMPQHRNTPIIFLTKHNDDDALEAAFAAGGDDFIAKPASPAAIRARLKARIQRAEYSRRLERLRDGLKQYLSKKTLEVVENLSPDDTVPPPQEQDLAICFTDMRGFTAFSEDAEPNRLFSLVSALLADQVHIVHEFGGYVDKFGGDGVMAIFEGPNRVLQSCLCALSILESARLKHSDLPDEMRRFGIGIHAGRAVIGNIGSPEHLDYSAIGSTVNLAARLCGQAQAMSIAVSKAVRDAAVGDSRLNFHSKREVVLRGMKDPVPVYTLTMR